MPAVGFAPRRSKAAEDIRVLQCWTRHASCVSAGGLLAQPPSNPQWVVGVRAIWETSDFPATRSLVPRFNPILRRNGVCFILA